MKMAPFLDGSGKVLHVCSMHTPPIMLSQVSREKKNIYLRIYTFKTHIYIYMYICIVCIIYIYIVYIVYTYIYIYIVHRYGFAQKWVVQPPSLPIFCWKNVRWPPPTPSAWRMSTRACSSLPRRPLWQRVVKSLLLLVYVVYSVRQFSKLIWVWYLVP